MIYPNIVSENKSLIHTLLEKLDDMFELGKRYAADLPDQFEMARLRRIVPHSWKMKLLDRSDLQTPKAAVRHIQNHLRVLRSEKQSSKRHGKPDLLVGNMNGANSPPNADDLFNLLMKLCCCNDGLVCYCFLRCL